MASGYSEGNYVYNVRPYLSQAYCLSDDGLEDDVCVWGDGPTHSEIFMSEERLSFYDEPNHPTLNKKNAQGDEIPVIAHDVVSESGSDETEKAGTSAQDPVGLTNEQYLQRQTADALFTTQKNLTRMLQFILKLERRAGKVTKEGIRQTLDATVASSTKTSEQDRFLSHYEEIENLKILSENAWKRLYLVDRQWRRQHRQEHNGQEPQENHTIQIESEPGVKAWLQEEVRINDTVGEDPCYYTVADLASGRSFEDWVAYLRRFCNFKDHPADEAKLVDLAWRFLDRSLRAPQLSSAARASDFVLQLEEKSRSGAFNEALENPGRQVEDDKQAWKIIKRCLGSKIHHYS
ncbi:uncharacterized protein GGS22DRAFT_198230 [Annulohypoxylon maeteangense]|uniref:uncharacterized protein n=1 Tax=Annulohypoxylon maeteangense TaxID=1927788 RepID=UPI002007A8A5|nr:uncharacterized protein GGS22DRAFT_198230 [Annulohypoxylon maeteangense]KAI0888521.1 hypothetical protein GGS22DRAFT_198230 [Annulohypoxylon maeteangense]